jgi:hypothetical protein
MHIFVKTLSGAVQTLEFSGKTEVSVPEFELCVQNPGHTLVHDAPGPLHDQDVVTVLYMPDELNEGDTRRVEDVFRRRMLFFDRFRELIQNYEAVVAGGSVICALHDIKVNDFDIYIHQRHATAFIEDLLSIEYMEYTSYHARPVYDQSFMKRNHILGRFHLETSYSRYVTHRQVGPRCMFDVMVVPDTIALSQVTSNFDLTFCQVWWDGTRLHATHVADVRTKHGSLQPEYISSYLNCNSFTCSRIRKYVDRGFHVSIDSTEMSRRLELGHLELTPQNHQQVLTKENCDEWKVMCVYRTMVQFIRENVAFSNMTYLMEYQLIPMTELPQWHTLIAVHGREMIHVFIDQFERTQLMHMKPSFQILWERPDEFKNSIEPARASLLCQQWLNRLLEQISVQIDLINGRLHSNLENGGADLDLIPTYSIPRVRNRYRVIPAEPEQEVPA